MGFKKLFKKAAKVIHPIGASLMGDDKKQDYAAFVGQGEGQARRKEIDDAMKEYENVPTLLRQQYTDAAKRAGTYAGTAEFGSGLESEVVAGSRGARVGLAARINALKKALGDTDEFKPEGLGQTQANVTQDALRDNPERDSSAVSPAAATSDVASDATPTSVASLQNPNKRESSRFVALKKSAGYENTNRRNRE